MRYASYWRPTANGKTDYLSITIVNGTTAQVRFGGGGVGPRCKETRPWPSEGRIIDRIAERKRGTSMTGGHGVTGCVL
jgi:hypothetical protein